MSPHIVSVEFFITIIRVDSKAVVLLCLSLFDLFLCCLHIFLCADNINTPNGYIAPMEFRVHFFPRISAFLRRTKMHLNEMFLIGTDFFKIIVPL